MEVNGGGYTLLSRDALSRIDQSDVSTIFTDKSNVLLFLQKPDNTQPYTIIKQYIATGGVSVQVNAFAGYMQPRNHMISDYLYVGLLPENHIHQGQVEGFVSNGHNVTYTNCNGETHNYFAFYTAKTPVETRVFFCDTWSFDSKWRGTATYKNSSSKIPMKFFMLTVMYFGGCGCYAESGSWANRANPANSSAIGLR